MEPTWAWRWSSERWLQVSIPQHEGVNFLQFGYVGVAVIHSFISLMYYASKITSPSTTLLNFQSYLSKAPTVLQGKRSIRMNRALRPLNAMILCTHSLKIRIWRAVDCHILSAVSIFLLGIFYESLLIAVTVGFLVWFSGHHGMNLLVCYTGVEGENHGNELTFINHVRWITSGLSMIYSSLAIEVGRKSLTKQVSIL
jgi:hypothetical protein